MGGATGYRASPAWARAPAAAASTTASLRPPQQPPHHHHKREGHQTAEDEEQNAACARNWEEERGRVAARLLLVQGPLPSNVWRRQRARPVQPPPLAGSPAAYRPPLPPSHVIRPQAGGQQTVVGGEEPTPAPGAVACAPAVLTCEPGAICSPPATPWPAPSSRPSAVRVQNKRRKFGCAQGG